MKKVLSILVVNCELFAACPVGYTEIDAGAVYAFHPTSCPAGYTEVSSPVILPSPAGSNDSKGSFTYEACSYQ